MDGKTFAVVVPAHQAERTIGDVLDAILAARPAPQKVVVFCDGCTDGTASIARSRGVDVIENTKHPVGPAVGRNLAAAEADTDYVAFVDSDVVVNPDAFAHLIDALEISDDVSAVFGAYGEFQAGSNLAARYTNLRHHYFHVHGDNEAETFWTGLGMVRRDVFDAMGGFDNSIDRPAMEDIELGFRMRARGHRLRIAARSRGTHLKNWTVLQLWRDDVFSRAIPWSEMIVDGRGKATLNASRKEQVKAGLAHLCWMTLMLSFFNPIFLIAFGVVMASYLGANQRFYRTLLTWGGPGTLLAGMPLHFVYYLYSSVAFTAVLVRHRLGQFLSGGRGGRPNAGAEAKARSV